MKKLFTKQICVMLMLAMLIPMMTFMASAAEITNLYDASLAQVGTPPATKDGNASGNANYYTSNLIEVKEGDVLTFGPCFVGQGYYLTTYDADGARKIAQVTYADCTEVDVICGNAVIVKWTVPAESAYVKMATSQMFFDSTVITVNQEFNKDDYFALMDKAGVNVDYLKPHDAEGTLTNVFPVSDKTFKGRSNSDNTEVATDAYRTSDYIPVQEGDILYFAAASMTQGYHLTLYNVNKKATTNVQAPYMVMYEDLGREYAIYAYRMRPGTGYVRIVAASGVYEDGIEFATVNQPFTGDTYRKMFNITISDTPTQESPLNGLTALFMGDSISYGAGDSASYLRTGRAWAGRIQDATGLIAKNASVSGAKVSNQAGDDNWVYSQYLPYAEQKFDLIVMHGGVNDARYDRPVGTLSQGTDEATLEKNQNTYVGGLEWIFYNVKKTNTEAKLFFIANHRLDGHDKGSAKDMSAYFNAAKAACEKWGVIFIDLYNNKELNDKLETTTTKYLPDTLHLNAAGYDIITPYIIEALEAGLKDPEPEATEPEMTEPETTEPEATEPEATDPATEQITEPTAEGGCGGMIAGAVAVIALLGTAVVFKKKD